MSSKNSTARCIVSWSVAAAALVALAGCETPQGNAALGYMYAANAANETNPQKANSYEALSSFFLWSANR